MNFTDETKYENDNKITKITKDHLKTIYNERLNENIGFETNVGNALNTKENLSHNR